MFSGAEVAQYCSKFLPDCIKDTDQYKEGELGPALVDAFLKFDSTLVQDDVIKELKQLAGVDENDEEEDGNLISVGLGVFESLLFIFFSLSPVKKCFFTSTPKCIIAWK